MSEAVDYAHPDEKYPPGFRARRGLNWGSIGLLYACFYLCRYNFPIANEAISKEFGFSNGRAVEVLAEFFNVFNRDNLFSNPNVSAVVPAELDHVPQPGDCFAADGCAASPRYRTLDQISPGSTPFAVQLGARVRF